MEEDYKYLESKSINELIEIIDNFTDIDETIEALYILSDLDEEKTLEKGMYFLWNNEVDEFFQARVVGLLGFIDIDKVFYCLINRNDEIQPYLLGNLMREISGRAKNENIVEYFNEGFIVEGFYHNDFLAMQRVLSFGAKCTVLAPDEFKNKVVNKIKEMRKLYEY